MPPTTAPERRRLPIATALLVAAALALAAFAAATFPWAARAARPGARPAASCDGSYPATRDPSNPLALPSPPGADPLTGATFFVQGPRHGLAAGAIAQLLGIPATRYGDAVSWERFARAIHAGKIGRRLATHPALAHEVALLSKVAEQPETVRFSSYSGGGGPGAVLSQVRKFLCHTLRADPHTVPLISTYFLHRSGGCPTLPTILADRPLIARWSRELAKGIGRHPAVLFLELDAIGASSCMSGERLAAWLQSFRIEVRALAALPHTVVYLEAGYSDSLAPPQTARRLLSAGVRLARGFFTNDTHFAWTTHEIAWAERVSALTGGSGFVVNTADNGRGPLLNPHPARQGIEALCNPPGRGLGPQPTARTGVAHADAFVWTGTPGRSAGDCGRGYAPPGLFDPRWAMELSARANGRLGPGHPSRPY